MKKLELRASTLQQFAALGSLILMMILFSILSPYFLNFDNLITVIKQTSVVGIIAIGVTLVIVTGGIDLSLGSVVALSGVVAGFALAKGASNFVGILIGALIGLLCGLISGVIVAYLELPAFIATLGMMMSARGMSLVLTQGRPVYIPNNKTFNLIHNYNLFKYIPLPVI